MALSMDSDEEESFVVIGKQVKQLDDDEARKKPVSVHDLPVKDSKGRQRFHGAFTGGFSAGYFNSVGTKEGWAPSTFVSSRKTKSENLKQKVEDFMDEDDFGEHGIAPRKIATSENYTSEERQKKRKALASAITGDTIGQGQTTLMDLVVPDSLPIGVRLLRKMGWKEGQGIGPRLSRKLRKKKEKDMKIYGCSMKQKSSSEDEGSDDEYFKNITFAPKDTNPISFVAKDNIHGIGYRGLDPSTALPSGHINLFEAPPVSSKKGKRGIRGKGFGVGALEEDDDDIYTVDHLSNYDMTMDLEDKDHLSGWTAPKGLKSGKGTVHVGYVGKLLEGFTLSTKTLKQTKVYPPPALPRHFKPIHRFKGPVIEESIANIIKTSSKSDKQVKKLTSIDRGLVLGEKPVIGSIFDLVSKEDKEKMEKVKSGELDITMETTVGTGPSVMIPVEDIPLPPTDNPSQTSRWDSTERKPEGTTITEDPLHPSPPITVRDKPLFIGSVNQFKPFLNNPEKQERYDKYLSLVKLGRRDAYLDVTGGNMTEWEREREREEFIKAFKFYKPLSGMMASRFTMAKYSDDTDKVDDSSDDANVKSDKEKAVEMKMFGQLTRDNIEWHPDKTLCKRFNVPDPYPGSSIIGLLAAKRDKYSVYNFLSFPVSDFQPSDVTPNTELLSIQDKTEETTSNKLKQKSTESSKVSFNMKKKPSIFNVLFDDDNKATCSHSKHTKETMETTPLKTNTEEVVNLQDENKPTEPTPPLDLYRAIFQNSDSEESSSSSEEEENSKKSDNAAMCSIESKQNTKSPSLPDSDSTSYRLPGDGTITESLAERLSPALQTSEKESNVLDYSGSNTHRFSLPSSSSRHSPPSTSKQTSKQTDSGEVMYGPVIPMAVLSESRDRLKKSPEEYGKTKHKNKKKQKDKYEHSEKHKKRTKDKSKDREKHKHRIKDKKANHKKHKEKKSKKKKKSKMLSESESSDDSDCVILSDDKLLEEQILSKLRDVSGKRLKAADFM